MTPRSEIMTTPPSTPIEKLAAVLDRLPTGFTRTESGAELKLLAKIFTDDEALLFCDLKLSGESVDEIAARTGRPIDGLEEMLTTMWKKGQILRDIASGEFRYRMVPWVVGIFEFQIGVMNAEFAALHRELMKSLGAPLFLTKPSIMQVVPVERVIPDRTEAMPYERASAIIDEGSFFSVSRCICKTQSDVSGRECKKPHEVCIGIADDERFFDDHPMKPRRISKAEAHEILKTAEDAGLIHMTSNVRKGHWYLCNCCSCCCFQIIAARKGIPGTVNAHYVARIDPSHCKKCDRCADERCQVGAVSKGDAFNSVDPSKCIGCGLCASACPSGAVSLERKPQAQQVEPPENDDEWTRARGIARGVDYSDLE